MFKILFYYIADLLLLKTLFIVFHSFVDIGFEIASEFIIEGSITSYNAFQQIF